MLEEIKERINSEFGFECEPYDTNMLLVKADKERIREFLSFLKENGFSYGHAVSVVDYTPKGEGFQVNYVVEDVVNKKLIMVRVELPADNPSIPSVYDIYYPFLAHEREAWEMFGVEFVGHPRLEVMLLPEWAEGWFPLRKSYDFKKHRKPSKEKK